MSLFWIEHNSAIDQDTIPLYPPPMHLLKSPYSTVEQSHGLLHRDKAISFAGLSSLISSDMFDILTDLSILTVALKLGSARQNIWEDPDFAGFRIYPTLYKLLTIQAGPEEDEFRNLVQEICRLGAILFLSEIRRKFGVSPVVTKIQITKLRRLFETNHIIWDKSLEPIRIWVLVMAGCAGSMEAEGTWVAERLVQSRTFMTCAHWGDIIAVVSSMWWIDEVFSSGFKSLETYGSKINLDKESSKTLIQIKDKIQLERPSRYNSLF
jgi:hypothetical protein